MGPCLFKLLMIFLFHLEPVVQILLLFSPSFSCCFVEYSRLFNSNNFLHLSRDDYERQDVIAVAVIDVLRLLIISPRIRGGREGYYEIFNRSGKINSN
jgi:hypothetical protein